MAHPVGMNAGSLAAAQQQANGSGYDFFRLSKSKSAVDLAPNTLRAYNRQGLAFYRRGRVVFVSKAELHQFICARFTNHRAAAGESAKARTMPAKNGGGA